MVSSCQSLPHLVNSWAKIALLGVFLPQIDSSSVQAFMKPGEAADCSVRKKDNAPQSITMHSLISIIPLVPIAGRERGRSYVQQTRPAVSSLTALLKAKGWIAVCSPALPFGLAENCGSVMPIDPDAHTGHQRRFLLLRPPAFTVKWLACRRRPNPVTHI